MVRASGGRIVGGETFAFYYTLLYSTFAIAKNSCLLSSVIFFFIPKVEEPHGEPLPLMCSENLSSRGHGRFNIENVYSQANQTVVLLCNIYTIALSLPQPQNGKYVSS